MEEQERRTIYQRLPFFYGWVIFFATLLIYMMAYGLRYSFGVFFTPLREEFGWTAATTAGALSMHLWIYGATAPFTGRITEKIGVRMAVVLGGLFLGGGAYLVSYSREILHLYLFWGFIAPIGAVMLYVIPTIVLAKFFVKKRGRVVGWASVGISLGSGLLVPLAGRLVQEYGWRTSYQIFGGMTILIVGFFGYIIMRDDPESLGLRTDGIRPSSSIKGGVRELKPEPLIEERGWTVAEVIRTRTFAFLAFSYFFLFGSVTSLNIYFVPHIIQLGIDPVSASQTFGAVGLMSAVGSFVFGFVSDLLGRKPTIVICTSMIAALAFILASIPPILMLFYLWGVAYGIAYGGVPEQYAAIVVDYFGRRHSTSVFGLLTFFGAMGGGFFPLISGLIRDLTGTYSNTLLFLAFGSVLMTLMMFPVAAPSKKQTDGVQ